MSIVWSLEQRFQCNLNHSNRSSNKEDMTETILMEKSRADDVADFFNQSGQIERCHLEQWRSDNWWVFYFWIDVKKKMILKRR